MIICDKCMRRDICTKLCNAMETLLEQELNKDRKYSDSYIKRNEVSVDPVGLKNASKEGVVFGVKRDVYRLSRGKRKKKFKSEDIDNQPYR